MTNKFKINTVDIYTTYGATILKGSYADLLMPAKPRKRLEHEYTDQNGVKVDKISPLTFEPKRFSMRFAIKASSDTEFWSRYNAFFAAVAVKTYISLWIYDLNATYTLYYEGCTKVEKLTRIAGSNFVYAVFDIQFLDPNSLTP